MRWINAIAVMAVLAGGGPTVAAAGEAGSLDAAVEATALTIRREACAALILRLGQSFEEAWLKDPAATGDRDMARNSFMIAFALAAPPGKEDRLAAALGHDISIFEDFEDWKRAVRECGLFGEGLVADGVIPAAHQAAAAEKAERRIRDRKTD